MDKDPGLDYAKLFPGRFLKAGEFDGKAVTLTIKSIEIEDLPGKKGDETKGIIGFEETKKKWVLNRTNGECLKGMWGRKTGHWIGHKVTLYPAPFEGDVAIRVKGSPDLSAPLELTIELPRKRPFKMTMQVTGKSTPPPEPAGEKAA